MIALYFQGITPITFSPVFSEAVRKLTKQFLLPIEKYGDLLAVIAFLKEHPSVNEKLLEYAVTATIIIRDDVATEIISPMEVRHGLNMMLMMLKVICRQRKLDKQNLQIPKITMH